MRSVITVAKQSGLPGKRHATDADHVIAVSTIVSRQRSIRSAGRWDCLRLWSQRHDTVGSGQRFASSSIMKIPPRVGLAMNWQSTDAGRALGVSISPGGHAMDHRQVGVQSREASVSSSPPSTEVGIVHGLAGSAAGLRLLCWQTFGTYLGRCDSWSSGLERWRNDVDDIRSWFPIAVRGKRDGLQFWE